MPFAIDHRIALGSHSTTIHSVVAPLTKACGAGRRRRGYALPSPCCPAPCRWPLCLAQLRQTQDEQALALLRASSAQSAIITFCGKHFAIDGTTALRISQTARDVATKVLGPERANAAFKDELARRYAEVREVVNSSWCAEQRDELSSGEVRIFKD